MLTFSSSEFETEVRDCLRYVEEKKTGFRGLNLEFFDINSEDFDPSGHDDIVVDDTYEVSVSPDYSDEGIELTLREFIDLINETKSAKLIDNTKCITKKRCLIRVTAHNYKDISTLDILHNKEKRVFKIESNLDEINFSCSLISEFTIFGFMVHFADDYDKYNPSILSDDMFVEVIYDKSMSIVQIDKIFNSYIFEINASHDIKVEVNPRPTGYFDEVEEEQIIAKSFILRPLLFGKGIDELLKLYNIGIQNYDYSIIQYTKVIEYVSQTVIREEITNKAQSKLLSPKALCPDANYIKELEQMFVDFKQKFDSDRSAIKITIKTCCDILEVIGCSPKFLKKIKSLKDNLQKNKADKESLLESAYDLLADSISDTRNYIAHAKANYNLKGNECPESEKEAFVDMLRILAIQTIRWYSTTYEGRRIVND